MHQIIQKMRETVEAIEQASTALSDDQKVWAEWWHRYLGQAIIKAIRSGWVKGEL
jgi:heme A synthase